MTQIPLTFEPGHRILDLTMSVYYPADALKSRRARARFRKQHKTYVRRTWREVRAEVQRQGAIPGRLRYVFLEPMTFTITTLPMAEATPVEW